MLTLTWFQILSLVAGSSVIAALLTQFLSAAQERFRRGRAASFLAIKIATLLETFSEKCMSVIGDFDTYRQSSGSAGGQTTKLPNVDPFPEDADGWRALPQRLTAKVLSFPNHIRAAQESISFSWSVAGDEAAWSECHEECAKLGTSAWEIASELRIEFGFPPFNPRYDVGAALKREVAEFEEGRRSRKSLDSLL